MKIWDERNINYEQDDKNDKNAYEASRSYAQAKNNDCLYSRKMKSFCIFYGIFT